MTGQRIWEWILKKRRSGVYKGIDGLVVKMTFLVSSFPFPFYPLIYSHVTIGNRKLEKNRTKSCSTGFPHSSTPSRGKKNKFGIRITEFGFKHFIYINSNYQSMLQVFYLILYLHFTDEEMKVQRSDLTCLKYSVIK